MRDYSHDSAEYTGASGRAAVNVVKYCGIESGLSTTVERCIVEDDGSGPVIKKTVFFDFVEASMLYRSIFVTFKTFSSFLGGALV